MAIGVRSLVRFMAITATILTAFQTWRKYSSWSLLFPIACSVLPWITYRLGLYPKYFTPFRDLPTPQERHWLLGNCTDIFEHVCVILQRMAPPFAKERIVRVYLPLNIEVLVPVSPRALQELLIERSHEFTQPEIVARVLSGLGIKGLPVTNGDHHKMSRRQFSRVFSPRNMRSHYPVFLQDTWEMVQWMESEQASNGVVDVSDRLMQTAIHTTCETILGCKFDSGWDESVISKIYTQWLSKISVFSCIRAFLPRYTIPWCSEDNGLDALRSIALKIVDSKERAECPNVVSCMVESGMFSQGEMLDETLSFLYTSVATTHTIEQWAIYTLCRHPDIQRRLREEVRTRLSRPTDEVTRGHFLTTIEDLPYLRAFCNEVLRYYTVVSMLCRRAECDTFLDGVYVPKGTLLLIPPPAINRNPEIWGPRAHEFDPDRWLHNPSGLPSGTEAHQCAFLTFGQGPRSCIGQSYTRAQLLFLVAVMVGYFEMDLETPSKEVGLTGGVFLMPRDSICTRLKVVGGW